jgi:hypothetical protein
VLETPQHLIPARRDRLSLDESQKARSNVNRRARCASIGNACLYTSQPIRAGTNTVIDKNLLNSDLLKTTYASNGLRSAVG